MDQANVSRPNVRTAGPTMGIALNAPAVMFAPTRPSIPTGSLMIEDTRTRPVSKQTTIVSQNTPDMEISACLAGFLVAAHASTIGAEPRPDSFVNRPRDTPARIHATTVAPTKPPPAAAGLNAPCTIAAKAAGI